MSTVMEWPTIADAPPPADPEVVELLPALQTLREHSLAELNAVERGLAKLKAEHGSTNYDITTPHGYKLASARRHAVRMVRYQVPKVVTAKREELNEIRDAVKTEGARIIAALMEIESPHDALIVAEDARKAAEKAERERIEAERKAKHEAGIATIRSYAERCAGLSSERIAAGIEQLKLLHIAEGWEEFKDRAHAAKADTLASMRDLYAAAEAREEEAARLEAQRIENARIAAEQAAERQRLAEAAAKVKADAEALQRRIDEQAEREAQAERLAQAERDVHAEEHRAQIAVGHEQARLEAGWRLQAERAASGRVLSNETPEVPGSKQVLKATAARPDATDLEPHATASPVGGPMGAGQPAAAVPAGDVTETLVWHDATARKPDDDRTVLCWGSEGFFCGYWTDEIGGWIACESGGSVLGITHWSQPRGPRYTNKETTC